MGNFRFEQTKAIPPHTVFVAKETAISPCEMFWEGEERKGVGLSLLQISDLPPDFEAIALMESREEVEMVIASLTRAMLQEWPEGKDN